MHHFIYPSQDTYISSRPGYADKNFGIDEILQVGTSNAVVRALSSTKNYNYTNTVFAAYSVQYFTGIFTGSLKGTVANSTGTISGSAIMFSASYFSGSIGGGAIAEYNGGVSGSLSGSLSASFSGSTWIGIFTGQLTGSSGCLSGTASGVDIRNDPNWTTTTTKYVDRSLLKFDLTAISNSIVAGAILTPKFHLKLKVCNEYQLPITYKIYAMPVDQSWNMGNGYFSDGGSTDGVNWQYRDFDHGTQWYATYTSSLRPTIDFITAPAAATKSFAYGGGTWNTASAAASQSFTYQASDIDMDVTNMVLAWISGSLTNEGFLLVSSDELQSTGSGFTLKFFSKDTNTIYSPYLDVMWLGNGATAAGGDEFATGSLSTASVLISTMKSGMNVTVQTGSTFTISGGVSGIFSGSTYLLRGNHYITASNVSLGQAVQLFTGNVSGSIEGAATYVYGVLSGSGWFTASYFSGSIEGTTSEINNTGISSSFISGSLSGSLTITGSMIGYVGQVTSSAITIIGTVTGYYLDTSVIHVNGIVDGKGSSGNIKGLPVIGNYEGTMTPNEVAITGPCGKSFSASLVTASLTSGIFSGSIFGAYYTDDQKLENAHLSGSWTLDALLGASVYIPIPSGIEPFAYAYVSGQYIYGKALGYYTISGSISASLGSNSASFIGQFVEGPLRRGYLNVQLSGSVLTSSYAYTSSITFTSTEMTALDVGRPFAIVVQNVHPTYKVGDIAKIGVFGRKQFPLKTFGISSQQEQYLVPEYLPTSSYYALKDNETGEIVIDFDSYTQIGCEYPDGNYFVIDTTGLPQERYYRVLVRVENDGQIYTMDCGKVFKITR